MEARPVADADSYSQLGEAREGGGEERSGTPVRPAKAPRLTEVTSIVTVNPADSIRLNSRVMRASST